MITAPGREGTRSMGTCLKSTQEPEDPPRFQRYWVKFTAFVCQHIYIPGCALMERLWVEGYWSPSRLPSGGRGGSCVAPHNLITSYHRSQHIDSNLDNNLNNILDNNMYTCAYAPSHVDCHEHVSLGPSRRPPSPWSCSSPSFQLPVHSSISSLRDISINIISTVEATGGEEGQFFSASPI